MFNTNSEKIRKTIMTIFMEDYLKNKGPSHITDLTIITIKSLMPSESKMGVYIDYERYNEEIKLWKYYQNGHNSVLSNVLGDLCPNVYWQESDNTALLRIIPLVLANEDYTNMREELIKHVLFFTGKLETIIEALLISKMLHSILMDKKDIIDKMKQEVITFSQADFIKEYGNFFRASIEDYRGNFSIDFEQYKIYALSVLNRSPNNHFQNLEDCIRAYLDNSDASSIIARCMKTCLTGEYIRETDLPDPYENLASYVYNLRKGRIDPKDLRIATYKLPNIFEFDEGEVFYHSLLNKCKVMKKEVSSSGLNIYLATRLGIYKFIKNKGYN